MESGDYTLSELADIAGTTPRTVRYYVASGLLPSPGLGPGARYSKRHVNRLYLIRKLQRAHLPLAEIRSRLAALDDEDIRGLVEQPVEAPSGTALDYVRDVLANPTSSLMPIAAPAPAPAAPMTGAASARQAVPTSPPGSATGPAQAMTPAPAAPPAPPAPQAPPAPPAPQAASPPLAGAVVAPGPHSTPATGQPVESGLPGAHEPSLVPVARPAESGPAFAAIAPTGSEPPVSRSPDRSQWDRIALTDDVELHVRRPLDRLTNRRLERLVALARQLLSEDQQ